jgi:hypothetical protein
LKKRACIKKVENNRLEMVASQTCLPQATSALCLTQRAMSTTTLQDVLQTRLSTAHCSREKSARIRLMTLQQS